MLEADIIVRLDELRSIYWSSRLMEDVYGIELVSNEELLGRVRRWAARPRRLQSPLLQHGEGWHRQMFEAWFQAEEMLPLKWAAARLGMTRETFEETLAAGADRGLWEWAEDQVVPERLVRDLHRSFSATRDRLFTDHNDRASRVQEAIRHELGVDVKAMMCATSQALGERPTAIAADYDILTGEPMALRHTVWLDLKKAVHLRPDACGLRTFARYRRVLEPYLFPGEAPDVPAVLLAA